MRVWRICHADYRQSVFSGEGARRAGGRWNSRGVPVVYTSAHLSLAALELFVHLDTDLIPDQMLAAAADIPDDLHIEQIASRDLHENWHTNQCLEHLRAMGDAWIAQGRSAVLAVPSVLIPQEFNYLLNPFHPDFHRICCGVEVQEFRYDPRMWRADKI